MGGGTQTSGGVAGASGGSGLFGCGGYGHNDAGGGGGGFYGGGGSNDQGGGGGSGYINTSKLTDAFMYGYNVSISNETATKTYSTTNVSEIPTSNYVKSGNGAARITPVN